MTAYNTHVVCELPAVLWKPRPRSASATAAATLTPNNTSQIGGAGPDHDAVDDVRRNGVRPPPIGGISADHQQLVCGASALFDASTVPSLVVIEQLSLLTRNRLDAWTEPTSDCEIGVTVIDHGM